MAFSVGLRTGVAGVLLAVGTRLPEFEADPAVDALVSLVVTAVVDSLPDEPELD